LIDPTQLMKRLIETTAQRIESHVDELTDLDQAIGDGDHGLNMQRGFRELLAKRDEISSRQFPDAVKLAGTTLVMKVGGASGPLYGTLFMSLGKYLPEDVVPDRAQLAKALGEAINDVQKRGKSEPGQKTMLDVLVPVQQSLIDGVDAMAVKQTAWAAAEATVPMRAIKGRASYLGERSVGHMDPGARSSVLLVHAIIDVMEEVQ